jgi:hypothetical protein
VRADCSHVTRRAKLGVAMHEVHKFNASVRVVGVGGVCDHAAAALQH